MLSLILTKLLGTHIVDTVTFLLNPVEFKPSVKGTGQKHRQTGGEAVSPRNSKPI